MVAGLNDIAVDGVKGQGVGDLREDTSGGIGATVDAIIRFPELRKPSQYRQEPA